MRVHPKLGTVALVAAALGGCDHQPTVPDDQAEPSTMPTGARITVRTTGLDIDPDGYRVEVDGSDREPIGANGAVFTGLEPGSRTITLTGLTSNCTFDGPGSRTVTIAAAEVVPVEFAVVCTATSGARVTVRTTGLDVDPDGYRVEVDGSDREPIGANGAVFTGLEPGSRTITLAGLTSNCAFDGLGSRTVTIAAAEVVPVEFAVACTATSGVIGVDVTGSRSGERFQVAVDGTTRFSVLERSGFRYLEGVPAGAHVVSLTAPSDCSVEAGSQTVTVRAGSPIRDTVEVTFSVTCLSGKIRITAPTTGSVPQGDYTFFLCTDPYCDTFIALDRVAPNDTLLLEVAAGRYWAGLSVPGECRVTEQNPPDPIRLAGGTLVTVDFRVACS